MASSIGERGPGGCSGRDKDSIRSLVASFLRDHLSPETKPQEIVFQGLTVRGEGVGHQEAPTVPSALLASLRNLNPKRLFSHRPSPSRTLLHDIHGRLRGGDMLMVIGKPGSGCTTFLKTLANKHEEYAEVHGACLYGGVDTTDLEKGHSRDFAFAGEDDLHFHSLSVDTTLRFALNARTPIDIPDRSKRIGEDLQTLLRLFDLEHVANVAVGNDYVRGVSGGQRHRVTLAEALCTRARVLCLDNPTRGLDSSTALRVVQILREYTTQSDCCTAMSLYQANDQISKYCDKVLVLNEGHVAYFGPTSEAKQYFEGLGFTCFPQTSLADFLTSMSGDPQSRHVQPDHQGRPTPITSEDFEIRFRESKYFAEEHPVDIAGSFRASPSKISAYQLPLHRQIYECMLRHYRVHFTDRSAWVAEAAGTIAQALMLGTLFWNQQAETQGLYTRSSALFFCVLIMVLQATAEFGNTFAQRPILLKQKALCFYRPAAYALGQILADIPWKAIFVLYGLPIYWMVNFRRDACAFFTWYLSLYVSLMAMGVMFRTIAVFTTSATRAVLPVGILMNSLIIYTGFYVNPLGMKDFLGWSRFLNPMYYAFESVMLNEVAQSTYECSAMDTIPRGLGYDDPAYQTCAVQSSSPGDLEMPGSSYLDTVYGFRSADLWRNIAINVGFFAFFAVCVAIGMERFKVPAGRLATVFYSKTSPPKRFQDQSPGSSDEEKASRQVRENDTVFQEDCNVAQIPQKLESTTRRFAWSNLCLDIRHEGQSRRLLDNVSGWLEPGSMTALMGISGAGKTTLLDTLSQRVSIGKVTGDLYLDSQPLPSSMNRRSGFVQQQDVHLSTSTVREAFRLTARLRQPSYVLLSEKYAYVENVISMLDMKDLADALIGEPGAGLNLEQRKRVSIGVELSAKPDILLFLDEPTSGLDGDSAFSIIQLMRKLANGGQTILCTIHQPSFELIEQFDSLLLLVPGGKTAYFGVLGEKCEKVTKYFARHSGPCETSENPADYVLGMTADPKYDWSAIWNNSDERKAAEERLKAILTPENAANLHADSYSDNVHDHVVYAAPMLEQLRVVLRRAFLDYWRDPDYVIGKMQLNLWMGLINGLTFLQMGNTLTEARNHIFSIFIGIITGPVLTLQIEPRFIALRDQFLAREKESRVYHWSVFVSSAFIVELPFTLAGGLVYWLLWHYMAGYTIEPGRAAYALLMYELYQVFVASLAQLIASVFPTVSGAQLATGFVWLMVNTFNGPLSPPPLTPTGWRWFYNVSPLFYFVEAISSNAMHGLDIQCSEAEISVFRAPDGQTCGEYAATFFDSSSARRYLMDDMAVENCTYCPFANGDEYIQQYSFAYGDIWRNVGIFVGFILFDYAAAATATYLIFVAKWRMPPMWWTRRN